MEIREHGKEQPYIEIGATKLRLPFLHFKWEWPEAVQGFFLVTIAISIIPINQELLGVPFEVGLIMVAINTILYLIHPVMGDPVYPGWITPAITYVAAWVIRFEPGVQRIRAAIALQLLMAGIFFFMGITGLARKIMAMIPRPMRAGVILGAGISAVMSVFGTESPRMAGTEVSVMTGTLVSYFILYSNIFEKLRQKSLFWMELSKYGMLPGMIIAFGVGILTKEISLSAIETGFIPIDRTGELLLGYTVLSVGMPPLSTFISALPTAAACYIIAFGDNVLCEVVISEAKSFREDEIIEYNINRSSMLCAVRNFIMAIFAPYPSLCGPIWAAGTVATYERYKLGREYMDSIYGGVSSYIISNFVALLFMAVVSFFRPMLGVGLCVTLTVQGFACAYMAMEMVDFKEERGLCGIIAVVSAVRDVRYGIVVGIVLYAIIGMNRLGWFRRRQ